MQRAFRDQFASDLAGGLGGRVDLPADGLSRLSFELLELYEIAESLPGLIDQFRNLIKATPHDPVAVYAHAQNLRGELWSHALNHVRNASHVLDQLCDAIYDELRASGMSPGEISTATDKAFPPPRLP